MEMVDRHIYANPSYPCHFDAIFLPSTNSISVQSTSNNTKPNGAPPFYLPKNASETNHEISRSEKRGLSDGCRPLFSASPQEQKIQEKAADDNDVGGPIYEDIDRMCSYRGYPLG